MLFLLGRQDRNLIGACGIPKPDPHHEAVQLRLWQREGALVFDRVLGRHDKERCRERVTRAVNGYLAFLHRFKKRGLSLWGCPVDFVGEDHLGMNRAPAELELAVFLVVNGYTGHV